MGERPGVRHAIRNYSLLAVFGIVAGAAFLHFVWPAMSPFVPTAWSITYVLGLAAFDVAPRLWQRNFTTPDSFSMASDQYYRFVALVASSILATIVASIAFAATIH